MELSRPPGVFSSRIKRLPPSFSAFCKLLFIWSTISGVTASCHLEIKILALEKAIKESNMIKSFIGKS